MTEEKEMADDGRRMMEKVIEGNGGKRDGFTADYLCSMYGSMPNQMQMATEAQGGAIKHCLVAII